MNPIPKSGKAAARTALPQPPRTSQKVPRNSAAILFEIVIFAYQILLPTPRSIEDKTLTSPHSLEVYEPQRHIHRYQLYSDLITNVNSLSSALQHSFHRNIQQPDPGALLG
jgi:hypothetical protein